MYLMKLLIIKFLYYLGVDALFYSLNHKAKRIVTFHNVIPDNVLSRADEGLICFSAAKFERIVEEIGTHYHFSNELKDPKTCTITFDDGYANQLEVAGAILKRKGIPAILFLASDLLDSKSPLVVDQCVVWADKVPMAIAEGGFRRKFADRIELWQQAVRPLFASDGVHRGHEALKRLDAIWPIKNAFAAFSPEYRRLRFTGVAAEQLDEFKRIGWKFGHHTYSHFPVRDLTIDAARAEMMPPEEMKDIVFSFPYGDEGSVSERDVRLVEELGYPCAVSNEVEATPLCGRYFLPRFMITTDDKYMIHFQLSGLKYFLKYRRLLPTCAF